MPKNTEAVPPVEFDGTVIIDTREQAPYLFRGFIADAKDAVTRNGEKVVPELFIPTKRGTLKTGDYSLEGYESKIAIERKSLADLYSTISQNRERFAREMERMKAMDCAHVVIESNLSAALRFPPPRTKLNPKSLFRTIVAFAIRYGVHFHWAEERGMAEHLTFRLLERYHKEFCSTNS